MVTNASHAREIERSTPTIFNSASIITTTVISPTDLAWQQCLQALPHDFYHLAAYLQLEADRYRAQPEAIVICEGEAIFFLPYLIRDCLQTRNTSEGESEKIYDAISPYGYPGMLVSPAGQNSKFINKSLQLIRKNWQQRNICSAFIRLHPLLNSYVNADIPNDEDFVVCEQGSVVVVNLANDKDEIWQQIRSSHRTKINRLKRAGFEAKVGSVDRYLDVFMEIYRETMDRVNATSSYYFTNDYFRGLVAALGDRLNICVVETNKRVVAASLITESSGIAQYHLGGTRTEFLPQSPTTIMFNSTIEWAKSRNNRYLNLGGGLGGYQDSLYHFKSGFSQLNKQFMTMKVIVDRDAYDRLTYLRAKSLGLPISEIKNAAFFPAYRAS